MTVPDEAIEAAAKAFRETHLMDDALMNALEAAAPYLRAQALEDAADAAHDRDAGMDGDTIRVSEKRGFMQRHNVSAAARWLRARAAAARGGE